MCAQLSLSFSVCKFKSNRQFSCEGDFIYIAISMCFPLLSFSFTPLLFLSLSLSPRMSSHIRSVTSIHIHQSLFPSASLHLSCTRCLSRSTFHLLNYFIIILVMSLCSGVGRTTRISFPWLHYPTWDYNVWRIKANVSCRLISTAATLE